MFGKLFGKGKKVEKTPPPTLDEQSQRLGQKGTDVDEKIRNLDEKILAIRKRMDTTKGPAKERLKQQAFQLMKQRKMYEAHASRIYAQQFNMDQVALAKDSVESTMTMVDSLRTASKDFKKQFKNLKPQEIENLHDEMSDLVEDANEVSDLLGEAYGFEEVYDEDELEAELMGMEEEMGYGEQNSANVFDVEREGESATELGGGISIPRSELEQPQPPVYSERNKSSHEELRN